jgi:hypothetical protein
MSKKQQIVLAIALLGIVAMLLWVPYSATYKWQDSSWTTASAGYNWIFSEPSAKVCKLSIEQYVQGTFVQDRYDPTLCHIALDYRRIALTLTAATIGSAALLILLGLFGSKSRTATTSGKEQTLADLSGHGAHHTANNELAKELTKVNPNLQVGSGKMTKSEPLVITAKNDYIPIEYAVMDIVNSTFEGMEAQLDLQEILQLNDRHIDALTYKYRKIGEKTWTEKNTYYFDITLGMNERLRKYEKTWWQIWK